MIFHRKVERATAEYQGETKALPASVVTSDWTGSTSKMPTSQIKDHWIDLLKKRTLNY
jgi:hypothetical protein